jgi:hypothetical protein
MRALVIFTLGVTVTACKLTSDPDVHRYACMTADDCGPGWECKAQFAGGSLCFKVGECKDTETCDGTDENCDGRIDETFPEQGVACTTDGLGVCAAGTKGCRVGKIVCLQTTQPTTETCNGRDDDCNGQTDETFTLATDSANCGKCGQVCGTGTTCRASACKETTCDDLIDNDLNGLTDCADDSCFGAECATVLPPTGHCGLVERDGGADAGNDAGADAGPDAGWVRGCFQPETTCSNALDDDGDGLIDCLDPDCDGRTCMSGTVCTNRTCPGPG